MVVGLLLNKKNYDDGNALNYYDEYVLVLVALMPLLNTLIAAATIVDFFVDNFNRFKCKKNHWSTLIQKHTVLELAFKNDNYELSIDQFNDIVRHVSGNPTDTEIMNSVSSAFLFELCLKLSYDNIPNDPNYKNYALAYERLQITAQKIQKKEIEVNCCV